MKSIHTLVDDILAVVDGKGGWDATLSEYLATRLSNTLTNRLTAAPRTKGTLRMSNLGSQCYTKLWYDVNIEGDDEPLRPETKLKFLYGDLLEDLLIALAKAAGHKVEGEQDEMVIGGVKGHRDCVIDGVTVDVKSASSYAFRKFQYSNLREDDPFGYIEQLSSYVYAAKTDPKVIDKENGAFLVINKENGQLCLDMYNLEEEIKHKEAKVTAVKALVGAPNPPAVTFEPVPEGKSGNKKLPVTCSYCSRKKRCWPDVRKFVYSNGPVYLTRVVKTPAVPEVDL